MGRIILDLRSKAPNVYCNGSRVGVSIPPDRLEKSGGTQNVASVPKEELEQRELLRCKRDSAVL
jgi:hypothetical protein